MFEQLTQDAADDYNQARVHFKQLVAQATIADLSGSILQESLGLFEIRLPEQRDQVTTRCLQAAVRCASEIAHDNYEWNQ